MARPPSKISHRLLFANDLPLKDLTQIDEVPKASPDAMTPKVGLILLIGFCFVVFFLANVATPSALYEPIPAMAAFGVVTAQLTVICVWGTLVRGTFWIRLPWTLLLLVVSWCGLALGTTIENDRADTGLMLGAAAFLFIGFVTSYIPLKIAAVAFRWRITQTRSVDAGQTTSSRYAIRDIMIGTLLLAVAMGVARAMFPEDGGEISIRRALEVSQLNEGLPLLATSIYGIVSLLVKLPCIWIGLGAERSKIRSRIGIWVGYCLLLAVAEFLLIIGLFGAPMNGAGELCLGLVISHQLMGGIMLAVCFTLRGLGYRLERTIKSKSDRVVLDGVES